MTTGDKIAQERRKINLTQEQLAYKLGVTRQAVSRWESDLAYPETDKIIKLAELFGCSADYLLRDGAERGGGIAQGVTAESDGKNSNKGGNTGGESCDKDGNKGNSGGYSRETGGGVLGGNLSLKNIYYEYKSKATLFGLPLVHVNLGLGRKAKGIIAVGLISKGILSVGILPLGVFAIGMLPVGLFSFGVFALALLAAFGSVCVALFSFGAIAIGFLSFGAVAVGVFADGALACGYYLAVGDVSYGQIAIAKTAAHGSAYCFLIESQADFVRYLSLIDGAIENVVPQFLRPFAHLTDSVGRAILSVTHLT